MTAPYLEAVFDLLARDKVLPKNQFERRVDALLAPFLPEILGRWLRAKVDLVVPEFPIKDKITNRSTNVDHLCFAHVDTGDFWIFLELKTDPGSVSLSQLEIYAEAIKVGMPALLEGITAIQKASKQWAKYRELIDRLTPFGSEALPIQLVLLTASPVPPAVTALVDHLEGASHHTFDELTRIELDDHAAEWLEFRSRVLKEALSPGA